jgi:hypothetical protein
LIPKRIQSGSRDYPTPAHVFNTLIQNLIELDKQWDARFFNGQDRVYFRAKGYKSHVELRMHRKEILVDFWFPYGGTPEELYNEKGIRVPAEWVFKKYRLKKHVVFHAQKSEKELLVNFFNSLFRELYGCPENYVVIGKLTLGFWQTD